jgi:hypothetical protein
MSGIYHSTSTDGYLLSIAHLVIKVIQIHQDSIRKGDTMQPITSSNMTLHLVHGTSHAFKVKQDPLLNLWYYMHRGLPCSSNGLSSSRLGACGPLNSSYQTYSSFEKNPTAMGPTCDDDA